MKLTKSKQWFQERISKEPDGLFTMATKDDPKLNHGCLQCEYLLDLLDKMRTRMIMVGSRDEPKDGDDNSDFSAELALIDGVMRENNKQVTHADVVAACPACGQEKCEPIAMAGSRPIAVKCRRCGKKLFVG